MCQFSCKPNRLERRSRCALRDSFAHPQGLELGVKNHMQWNHDMVALSLKPMILVGLIGLLSVVVAVLML